ncbi:MAG: RloB family protein [Candidatus Sericytochromatia bacterium]
MARKTDGRGRKPAGSRLVRERILILCEGEQTEFAYFKAFPKANAVIDVVHVEAGGQALRFIQKCSQKCSQQRLYQEFDQIYCVFDYDHNDPKIFNQAVKEAYKQKLIPIYSHVCFELWYLLHFGKKTTDLPAQHGQQLTKVIRKALNKPDFEYSKNDKGMYRLLESLQEHAIEQAKQLASGHGDAPPHERCPSTSVYELVERLNRFRP